MGMYTEIMFAAEVDEEAFRTLQSVAAGATPTGHPFWSKPRWRQVFEGRSYYFPEGDPLNLTTDSYHAGLHWASFRANLKNYDGEVESFFDWALPHVVTNGIERTFVGYHRYEENDEPTLVYKEDR